jgi:hypothetical protein
MVGGGSGAVQPKVSDLEDDLVFLISRPKIPATFDSKSMIKKALHPFLPTGFLSLCRNFPDEPNWRDKCLE